MFQPGMDAHGYLEDQATDLIDAVELWTDATT